MITPRRVIEDICYRQLPVRFALGTPIAFVIHPELRHAPSSRPADLMLDEACLLANAIGLEVVHSEVIALAKLRAGSYFGKGMTERLGDLAEDFTHEIDAPVVIINTSLSPVQQRNLETQIKAKVIDRTQLILEIFGARAQTHAGRLQVELAALSFQRSRLVRSWTHLERQRGGGGFLGGPGERQIELDRRMLMDRVTRIKAELKEVTRTRTLQRSNRLRSETPTVATHRVHKASIQAMLSARKGSLAARACVDGWWISKVLCLYERCGPLPPKGPGGGYEKTTSFGIRHCAAGFPKSREHV